MIRNIFVVLALAVVAAFCYNEQTGPVAFIDLANGVTYSGALPIQGDSDSGFDLTFFRFWVPENASQVNITFANTWDTSSFDCEGLYYFYSSRNYVPCNGADVFEEDNFICASANYRVSYNFYGAESDIYYPGDASGLFSYSVNDYWYIGVGKYYSSDYEFACTYELTMEVTGACPAGTVAQQYDLYYSSETQCSEPYVYQNKTTASYAVTGVSGGQNLWKVAVPNSNIGRIVVTMTADNSDLELLGMGFTSPNEYIYDCDDYSGSGSGPYTYSMNCYVPREGNFYVLVWNDYTDTYSANVTITSYDCNTDSTFQGGYNCSFPVVPCNSSWHDYMVYIPYPSADSDLYLNGPTVYCYFDILEGIASPTYDFNVTAGTESYEFGILIRRDGFSEYDSYGYDCEWEACNDYLSNGETHSFSFSAMDVVLPGRYYLGLQCRYPSEDTGCTYYIGSSSVAPVTSGTGVSSVGTGVSSVGTGASTVGTGASTVGTGASTVGTGASTVGTGASTVGTGASTAGTTKSGSSIIVPSLFLVAALFVAMF